MTIWGPGIGYSASQWPDTLELRGQICALVEVEKSTPKRLKTREKKKKKGKIRIGESPSPSDFSVIQLSQSFYLTAFSSSYLSCLPLNCGFFYVILTA